MQWNTRSSIKLCTLLLLGTFLSACALNSVQLQGTDTSKPIPTLTATQPAHQKSQTSLTPSPTLFKSPTPEITQIQHNPTATQTYTITNRLTPSPTLNNSTRLTYSSNLLYLNEQQLMRWDYVTNFVQLISENIYEYSVNGDGRLVALMRSQNIVANGVELFELALLNFNTKQITTIIEGSPRLYAISLSPDGEWIAYYPNKNGGRLYAVRTDGSNETIELGFCHQTLDTPCPPITWSPDSRELLWSDQRGVWHTRLDWESPQVVTTNNIQVIDPHGEMSQIMVTFDSLFWSPQGRYALGVITPSTSITRWYAILDTRRKRLIEIPESFQPGTSTINVIWLGDGKLMVADGRGGSTVTLKFWEVIPTQNDLISLINSYDIISDDLPTPIDDNVSEWSYLVDWPYQINARHLGFGVKIIDQNTPPILFNLDLNNNVLILVDQIPSYSEIVLWSPDGQGALIIGRDQGLFFSPMDGGMLLDLNPILGDEAENFYWLPPTPRS